MTRRFRKRTILLAVTAVAALALAGGVFAYYTATGSGSGAATVDNPDPVTLTAGTPADALYPGTSAEVAVTISNPNPFRVKVPGLVLDTDDDTDGFDTSTAGCDTSVLTFTNQTVDQFVEANDTLDLQLADAVTMSTLAANECQGATFTVFLQVAS